MKKIWISSLSKNPERVQKTLSMLKKYGLDAGGHFWENDNKKMLWLGPRETLTEADTGLWMILSSDAELADPEIRYGLSMLTLSVQGFRGHDFPIMLIHEGTLPETASLPTPLQGAGILAEDNPALGAKIVAKVNMPVKKTEAAYRLDIYAIPQLGQWFEVGPAAGEWNGAMCGACGGEPDAHGAGPAGKLPQKAVLEYPMQGLKLNLGEKEYTAWAVQNRLDEKKSYYIRIQGQPDSLVFGPMSQGDDAEVFVLHLK
ncbi:MAG: hypothetical protein V2I97_22665 [Desulfococcaceae bacterium]|jgi:hypothetical protein|nr:hypothetical protein [Desulfococcaceae bacterium]